MVPFAGHEQLVEPADQRVHVEHEDEDEPAPQEHVHLLEDEVDRQRAVPVDATNKSHAFRALQIAGGQRKTHKYN